MAVATATIEDLRNPDDSRTPQEKAADHIDASKMYIEQAEEEFAKGDILQASEKAWGALVRKLKEMSMRHGLDHETHQSVVDAAAELQNDFSAPAEGLYTLVTSVQALHINFYNSTQREAAVRLGLDNAKKALAILDRLPSPPALSDEEHRQKRRLRERTKEITPARTPTP